MYYIYIYIGGYQLNAYNIILYMYGNNTLRKSCRRMRRPYASLSEMLVSLTRNQSDNYDL